MIRLEPMLALPVEIDDIGRKCDGYVMEPKLDGVRTLVIKEGNTISMPSRSGKQDFGPKVPHLVSALATVSYDFVLDGELGYASNWEAIAKESAWPILDFNRTMRVLGSGVDVALEKQTEEEDIFLWLFDRLDATAPEEHFRRKGLEQFFNNELNMAGFAIDIVDQLSEFDMYEYTQYVNMGGEGVMLKNPEAPYRFGKRPAKTWYKLKAFDTVDVVITGAIMGQGKYTDQIGALTFLSPQGVEGKCSGMDDATREAFTCELLSLIGKHMEVRFFGYVGADKSGMRHPNFVRLRPDLDI